MACITWKLQSGETYLVAEGAVHTPPIGAVNTGLIDWGCNGTTGQHEVDAMLEKQGVQWGSAIKWVTHRIGLKQCSSCKAREEILNHAKENGWSETIRQLRETL